MGIDNGLDSGSIINLPKKNIEAVQRENNKKTELNNQYLKLTADQQKTFLKKQNEIVGFFGKIVNSDQEIPNLLPEEAALVDKTRSFVKKQKELHPGETINVAGFSKEEDKLVYGNLIGRWAMAETLKPKIDSFGTFKKSNGETDGDFWWFQNVNLEADKLKTEGKFKWGDHRIYFDISLGDMKNLAELTEEIAADEKIAVGFKYLDLTKTAKANIDGSETRFVVNFANVEDAKRFYEALSKKQKYQDIKPDRSLDYLGHKIDDKANYANGFREKRAPLKNIIDNAQRNSDGTYSYLGSENKKPITITEAEYFKFKEQYQKMPDPKVVWQAN